MPEKSAFSARLLEHPNAKSKGALARISVAKKRVQSVLDREGVAHQKTLEQKIAEQGPREMRVDPHLVGLAVMDLLELNRLRTHHHPATGSKPWYANPATPDATVQGRLTDLAPLYDSISSHGFGNLIGDALEVVVFKCLDSIYKASPRYTYLGQFHLNEPKNNQGRYRKTHPPKNLASHTTQKEADFIQLGHDAGSLCIECKNYREWFYPHEQGIKDLIIRANDLNAIPVLIARRLHYTTRTNLLEPAGIIAHESYYQYYPADKEDLAERARHKRSLGFTDVVATEDPHPRTAKFISEILPKLVGQMNERWQKNRSALVDYANGELNLAQLYTEIGSPAGGKWQEFDGNAE